MKKAKFHRQNFSLLLDYLATVHELSYSILYIMRINLAVRSRLCLLVVVKYVAQLSVDFDVQVLYVEGKDVTR